MDDLVELYYDVNHIQNTTVFLTGRPYHSVHKSNGRKVVHGLSTDIRARIREAEDRIVGLVDTDKSQVTRVVDL